jgi:tetratricopeptide (TPR) repeat protein
VVDEGVAVAEGADDDVALVREGGTTLPTVCSSARGFESVVRAGNRLGQRAPARAPPRQDRRVGEGAQHAVSTAKALGAVSAAGYAVSVSSGVPEIVDLTRLDEDAGRAMEVQAGWPHWVVGDAGTGRGELLERLHKRGAVLVRCIEPTQLDAAYHAIVQAAAGIDEESARRVDATALSRAATEIADRLGSRVLALRLPRGWTHARQESEQGPWDHAAERQIRDVLTSWLNHKDLRTVLVTDRTADPVFLGIAGRRPDHALSVPLVRPGALEDREAWGALADAALELARCETAVGVGAQVLRISVAARYLGVDLGAIGRALGAHSDRQRLKALANLLEQALARHPEVAEVLRLLLAFRLPLPLEEVTRYTQAQPQLHDLFTRGLGYGARMLRFPTVVRRLRGIRATISDDEHARLAEHCASLDGQPEYWKAKRAEWWLEKHFHAAQAGDAGRAIWEEGVEHFPGPPWFWMRGRNLSRTGRFEEAIDIYRCGLKRFPDDAYGWHYLGYNTAKAGISRDAAERALRKAVELDKPNPWWNGRLVTFFIAQGRVREAEQAWAEAMERLDPDGERVATDRMLAEEVHRWVARAWLDAGDPERAASVLDELPEELFADSEKLYAMRHEVADAAEADQLGTSVYPSYVPMAERWCAPRLVAGAMEDQKIESWFPGRVVASGAEGMQVVLADPRSSEDEREVIHAHFTAEEWRTLTRDSAVPAAGMFIELHRYQDGNMRVVMDPRPPRPAPAEPTFDVAGSYLRRWSCPKLAS